MTTKRCNPCNIFVPENEWVNHLKRYHPEMEDAIEYAEWAEYVESQKQKKREQKWQSDSTDVFDTIDTHLWSLNSLRFAYCLWLW